jgi:nascent polypeptide-associated complex subunit alpha
MLPGGPRNARQMQSMMRRMGMTTEPVDGVEEVIIRTKEKDHVFQAPEVTILTVQGVRTYQVVGNPEVRPRGASTPAAKSTEVDASAPPPPSGPPEEDVELVMDQAEASREEALAALAHVDGAPAEAILWLLARRSSRGPG